LLTFVYVILRAKVKRQCLMAWQWFEWHKPNKEANEQNKKIMPYLMLNFIMYMVCCWKSAIMYLFSFYSLLDYFVICFLFVPCYIYTLFCSFASLLGLCHSNHCHAIKHWRFTLALIITYTNVSNFYQISNTINKTKHNNRRNTKTTKKIKEIDSL
jgi:hypothetical protein